MSFEIVTPERVVFTDIIKQITTPTKDGEITILPGHIPLVSTLISGVIEAVNKEGVTDIMALSGGFIEVIDGKVIILADTAEKAPEIDEVRAKEARERAEKVRGGHKHFDQERFASISADISKALAREKAAQKWRKLKGN